MRGPARLPVNWNWKAARLARTVARASPALLFRSLKDQRSMIVFRRFHNFRKHALHILGMDEKDGGSMRA